MLYILIRRRKIATSESKIQNVGRKPNEYSICDKSHPSGRLSVGPLPLKRSDILS